MAADLEVRERLGRALGPKFEVRRLLCRGERADVYEVWDAGLGRRLAVKVLRPDVEWAADMMSRFRDDIALIGRVNHPNILPIHFIGDAQGLVYYGRSYVEGESLESLLRADGPLGAERAIQLAGPLLHALQHAHERGLIHRGIKPANVLVDRDTGRPVLADFGVAQLADCAPARGDAGARPSPAAYFEAPEHGRGLAALDQRTDVYAMAATVFQMVTCALPFGPHMPEASFPSDRPPGTPTRPPSDRMPKWLFDVLLRGVSRDPDERQQSAAALLDDLAAAQRLGGSATASIAPILRRLTGDEPIVLVPGGPDDDIGAVTPQRPPPRPRRPGMRRGWKILLGLLLLVASAAVYLTHPALVFTNDLAVPVEMTMESHSPRLVAPGATLELRLPRGGERRLMWRSVRPTRSNNTPLGEEMSGKARVPAQWGRARISARHRGDHGDFFAPRITNATAGPLRLTVNAGLQGAIDCRCAVNAGRTRVDIGYYPLYQNSTVRATDSAGRTATFAALGAETEPRSGVIRLRFEDKDFRRP